MLEQVNRRGFLYLLALLATAAAVGCAFRALSKPYHNKYSIEMTVTGSRAYTNSDGAVWTELLFTQKPTRREKVYE